VDLRYIGDDTKHAIRQRWPKGRNEP
jgi:hypothetical protein